ncbi:REF/SRPP-like protein At1g67360 [Malania oleifera]|uniref:REF/SRPP-like protein At1g67360 n=1 Tax=Malania oleifera TaxID=397392 RepID=UPI0025AE0231|nr:REF/SRPP-like protein At1g67360 [Malania oleifera]
MATVKRLKYLGYVRVMAIHLLTWVLNMYEYTKHHSGPLQSPMDRIESVVITVLGPVYRNLEGVPDDLLLYLDAKVDDATKLFDEHAPSLVKWVVRQSLLVARKASQLGKELVHEAEVGGLSGAIRCFVVKFNKFLFSLFVMMWFAANKLPPFQKMAGMLLPAATQLLEKYNKGIISLANTGFSALSHLPSVPINKIGNAFKEREEMFNQGFATVMGGISNVMDKGSTTLSSVPIAGGAAEVATAAASAAQETLTNVMEKGSDVLSSVPVVGGATGAAQNAIGSVMEKGFTVLGHLPSVPLVGEGSKPSEESQS